MTLLLFILMSLSFAAATGFGVLALQLIREDRRRSAARVAALSAAIDGAAQADVSRQADLKVGPYGETRSEGEGRGSNVDADLRTRLMFGRAPGTPLKGRPLLKVAVAAVMALVIGIAAATSGGRRAAPPAATRAGSPLELMSMTSAREGRTLTVTGLVRNPPSGSEVRRVTAVVFAFDRAGGFVASGRAPLDFTVLDPDDESPFVVSIPNVGDVARYRVSFRTETGVIRHVDRRTAQSPLARSQ